MHSQLFSKTEVDNQYVIASLQRIMGIRVKIRYVKDGMNLVLETHLLSFIEYPDIRYKPKKGPILRFKFPKELKQVIFSSKHWGRIKAEIICAMTSKYAIQLYG